MKYRIAIHHRKGFDPASEEGPEVHKAIDDLNDEMVAAGVRVFVGGLWPVETAKSLSPNPDGTITVTDGPYLKNSEHVDGFWVVEVENEDEAIQWGLKAVRACRTGVDVRQFGGPSDQ